MATLNFSSRREAVADSPIGLSPEPDVQRRTVPTMACAIPSGLGEMAGSCMTGSHEFGKALLAPVFVLGAMPVIVRPT